MNQHISVLFCFSLILLAATTKADTHENVARFLPADVAFYGTFNSPSATIAELTSFVDTKLPTLQEAADLLLLTDLADGSRRTFDSSDLGVGILQADSIHFVAFDSRSEIGSFAILIDKGMHPIEVSKPVARLIFRFISQVVENGLPNNAHAGELKEVMSKWESTLDVSAAGQWIVVASSKKLATELVNQISDGRPSARSLGSSRRFQASSLTSLDRGFIKYFVAPTRARQIALSANFESETVWERKRRDDIPWIASSIQLNSTDEVLSVDKKTVIAAAVPLAGENRYWEFYRPIEQFPELWDEVHTVLGKSVDLEAWNELARNELDNVYGEGTLARYEDSPVSAFRTGLSRPKLGGLSFSIMDFENSRNLRLFKIDDDAPPEIIMGYLDAYYPALQENLRIGGYETTYSKMRYKALPGWWSKAINDDGPPSEQGHGALVLKDWVAIGSFAQLQESIDFDEAKVRVSDSPELGESIAAIARRMKFETVPHEFGYYRSKAVSGEMRGYASRLLQRVFPNGWHISQESRERGLEDEDVRRRMTRPQLLALYFTGLVDSYAKHKLEYVKVSSVSIDKSRFEIGETFSLTRVESGLESQSR